MKRLTRLLAVIAGALVGVTGFGYASPAAAADPEPVFVDLAISVNSLTLTSSAGQTSMFFTTPHRLKPSGDVTVRVSVFAGKTVTVNGRNCPFNEILGNTFQCVVRNSELPSGLQIKSVRLNVVTNKVTIIPRNETWSARIVLNDGDLTNNSSSARVFRN